MRSDAVKLAGLLLVAVGLGVVLGWATSPDPPAAETPDHRWRPSETAP